MSNRYMTQFPLTFERSVKSVFAKVAFFTTGDPVLDEANSKGLISIERNGVGDFTFVFGSASQAPQIDTYKKLLMVNHCFDSGASAPAAPEMYIKDNSTADFGVGSLEIILNSAGSAADPVSGEIGYFEFIFGDN